MNKENEEKSLTLTAILLAATVVIAAITAVFSLLHHKKLEKEHYEKWKDYDECGLS